MNDLLKRRNYLYRVISINVLLVKTDVEGLNQVRCAGKCVKCVINAGLLEFLIVQSI
jgi:hypothetical protein